MEAIKELAKCVKCNEFSEVDTDIALMSNPPQYQFTCSSCSNKQFIWGSFIYRIPRSILAKSDEYEAKAKAYNLLKSNLEKEVEILIDKVSGFPYVDAPIESTIGHFEYVLEMMKKYESGESQ